MDKTYQSVEWPGFQDAVWRFFQQHVEIELPKTSEAEPSMWQVKSVFDFCSRTVLVTTEEHPTAQKRDFGFAGKAGPNAHLPNAKVLQRIFMREWDVAAKKPAFAPNPSSKMSVDDQQWEDTLQLVFSFFVPAFIWAIHELNDAIKNAEKQIRIGQVAINDNRDWLNDLLGSDLPLIPVDTFPEEDIFVDGTGTQVRASDKWKRLERKILLRLVSGGSWDNIKPHEGAGAMNRDLLRKKSRARSRKRNRSMEDEGLRGGKTVRLAGGEASSSTGERKYAFRIIGSDFKCAPL